MAPTKSQASLLITYPHLPGFTLLSYQIKKDLEFCFALAITVEAADQGKFVLQLGDTIVFQKVVQTTTDIDRQQIYDTLAADYKPVAELPPQPKEEKIEEEWMHCHCSGE